MTRSSAIAERPRDASCHCKFHSVSQVNNGVTLKYGLRVIQGNWKWRHSIDPVRVPISITIASRSLYYLSCIIAMVKRHIGRKWRFFSYLTCIRRPRHRTIVILIGTEKLEWCGYPKVKIFEDMFNRRTTNGRTLCDSMVRAMHSIAW